MVGACVTVTSCAPQRQFVYTCAHAHCDGVNWTTPGPQQVTDSATGTVTCLVREGRVLSNGVCIPDESGQLLSSYTTSGLVAISSTACGGGGGGD
jgi:hypothetical protein